MCGKHTDRRPHRHRHFIYILKKWEIALLRPDRWKLNKTWTPEKWEVWGEKAGWFAGPGELENTPLRRREQQHGGTSHKTERCTNKPLGVARFFFSTPRCFLLIPGARRISLWGSQGSWLLGDEILVGTAWLESTQGFSLLSVAPDEETWCQKNSSFSRRVAADKKNRSF